MIPEIGFERVDELLRLSTDPQWHMLLAAIQAGNTRARLWQVASGFFLWDQANNVFYLAGEPPTGGDQRELAAWVMDGLRPLAVAERRPRFAVRLLNPEWQGQLNSLIRGVAFVRRDKPFYRFEGTEAAPAAHQAGTDVRLEPIDAAFLVRPEVVGVAEVLGEIGWMWPSVERFSEHGFGVAAVKANRVICWCTAEYVSAQKCGIGIETFEGFERLGVATAVTAEFVNHALQRGIRPHWECDAANTASMRVAEKSGFTLLQTTSAWMGRFI